MNLSQAFPTLKRERLDQLLRGASEARVLVVGDLMLDIYLSGTVERISPEAPVPVVRVEEERAALGGAANVAANVAALGAECTLIGHLGTDAAGDRLMQVLGDRYGDRVDARVMRDGERPTTTKTRVLARRQQVVRYDREAEHDLPNEAAEALRRIVESAMAETDVLVLEDYNKGVLSAPIIRACLETAAARGVPSVVDPKLRNFFAYPGATVFKPNSVELAAALGVPALDGGTRWMAAARERLGCRNLLLTRGEHGMALSTEGAPPLDIPALARQVYDVSGAGDTVSATMAVMMAAGATVAEAASIANLAAAVEVGKPGVSTVSAEEIMDVFTL